MPYCTIEIDEQQQFLESAGCNHYQGYLFGKPVYDMIVSLRTDDQDAWTQAIQDGQVGVYRQAAQVAPGTRSVLQVQIKRNGEEGILRFPLNVAP